MYNDKKRQVFQTPIFPTTAAANSRSGVDSGARGCGSRSFRESRHLAAEGFMYTLTALLNILAINIILVLVLVGIVQKKNSVSGHAQSENVIPGSC